jgi:RNA polymerase sigma factor (TIGR02999 family)
MPEPMPRPEPVVEPHQANAFNELLARARDGDRLAYDQAFASIYAELQNVARRTRRQLGGATLNTTGLVHECYLRLHKSQPEAVNASHFLGIASQAMRHLLIEMARARVTRKRGGEAETIAIDDVDIEETRDAEELLTIDRLLCQLDREQPQQAERRIHAWRLKAIRLNQDGLLDWAIAENRAAVASATERLGRENSATARAIHDLSGRLGQAGYADEALVLKREGHAILQRLHGNDHPETSLAALGLANLLVARGDYAEADALIRVDGEVRLRLWGDQHTEYGRHLFLLANYRLQTRQPQQALTLIQRAIAINQSSGASGRTALSLQYEVLGRVHEALGDLNASLDAYRNGQRPEFFGAKLGWDGGDLALGEARVLRKLGRADQAAAPLARAADLWQALPVGHPSRAGFAIEQAFVHVAHADIVAARAQAQRAHQLLPDPPNTMRYAMSWQRSTTF